MKKLYDIVRLILTTGLSDRAIAECVGASKSTVRRYRIIIQKHKHSWPLLQQMSSHQLDALFNRRLKGLCLRRMPDFAKVHEELQVKGVTLALLWEEYREAAPEDALSYSQFTHYYREYRQSIDRSMRQHYPPGEVCFVDFSGQKPHYIDPQTGATVYVELFVAGLGFSRYHFATCVRTQTVADWLETHIRMFEYFGGVPSVVVPDNLKAAVIKPGSHPTLNRTYQDFAAHYDFGILPARKYHPKDKAIAENGVRHIQRWILARLRHQQFFSLEDINLAVAKLLEDVNRRSFKKMSGSRQTRFDDVEKPALQPLPMQRYEWAEWTTEQRVGPDYHVLVKGHWYSVPEQFVRQHVEARITRSSVEIFHLSKRIATHLRDDTQGTATTEKNHMSAAHRAQADRTPEHFMAWAQAIGPHTYTLVEHQLAGKSPLLGLNACNQLVKLARHYGAEELESAAKRAIEIRSLTITSVRSLLGTGRHRRQHRQERSGSLPLHTNVRGPDYYAETPPASETNNKGNGDVT